MAINFNQQGTVNQVKYNSNDCTKVKYNGTNIWAKPYTLTISKSTGVSSVTVTRTSSDEPTAYLSTVVPNGTIYHSDVLKVEAVAETLYEIDGTYPQYVGVSGDTTISVTATPKGLNMPVITGTLTYNGNNSYYLSLSVQNTNDNVVSATISFNATASNINATSYTQSISANSTHTKTLSFYNLTEALVVSVEFRYSTASSSTSKTFSLPKIAKPIINTYTISFNPNSKVFTIDLDIYNNNGFEVVAYIVWEIDDDGWMWSDRGSVTISSKSTKNYSTTLDMYSDSLYSTYIAVYFKEDSTDKTSDSVTFEDFESVSST